MPPEGGSQASPAPPWSPPPPRLAPRRGLAPPPAGSAAPPGSPSSPPSEVEGEAEADGPEPHRLGLRGAFHHHSFGVEVPAQPCRQRHAVAQGDPLPDARSDHR